MKDIITGRSLAEILGTPGILGPDEELEQIGWDPSGQQHRFKKKLKGFTSTSLLSGAPVSSGGGGGGGGFGGSVSMPVEGWGGL